MPSARRKFRRLRKKYSKPSKKMVTSVAKAVMMRTLENHQLTYSYAPVWTDNGGGNGTGSYWYPITYPFASGTNDKTFTGSTVILKELQLRILGYSVNTGGLLDQNTHFRISLVGTDQLVSSASYPTSTYNYGYQYGETNNPVLMKFNPQVVTVLKDKKFTVLAGSGTNPGKVQTFTKRWSKGLKLEFAFDTNTGGVDKWLKNKQYYLVFSMYKPNQTPTVGTTVGGMNIEMTIKYKDN